MVAAAGAGAIGVNFWPGSKRFVGSEAVARRVLAAIPDGVLRVGVFVNAAPADVERVRAELGLDRVQLHGDETPAAFGAIPREALIRAVRVRDEASFADDPAWRPGLFLYDAFVDGFGGGGVAAPWPLIASRAARPDGVDVASGVEKAPGVKDAAKVAAFIHAARGASTALR